MAGFNFEKNLSHQTKAVNSTIAVFEGLEVVAPVATHKQLVNPTFDYRNGLTYYNNIEKQQEINQITKQIDRNSSVIDIQMETGTGKTYTYTKTIFELNKHHGIFKFIIVVPTLSIKAGTINFLTSDSSRDHFKEQYGKIIKMHVVESQKKSKGKRTYLPPAVSSFLSAGSYEKNSIQVLIINADMVRSDTMQKAFDKNLLDNYNVPFEAIAATKPFLIIDEPHKFRQENKTWANILKLNPQFILRYGATFPEKEIKVKDFLGRFEKIKVTEFHNLVYRLSSVDSFNQNLVKGVTGHITEFSGNQNAVVRFVNSDGKEATFEVTENGNKKTVKIAPTTTKHKESMKNVHPAMDDLYIEKLNKSTVELSNGLDLKKGDKINPYSYAETLQETMMAKAIAKHFEIERALLTREVKIKPLTLFFIDNIEEYRKPDGYLKLTIEKRVKATVVELLQTETDAFYKSYLEKTLQNISGTHGGYFSKDNSEKDEDIEKEVIEILHDKQAMLSLDNPRRFIFSKWTLREGWDNPNIFQICKLRSSGSDISKLQEVGRGLRLPVNEFGNRVKDEQFYLNYFVDFTETDFIEKLASEINSKSGAISPDVIPKKLHEKMIGQITQKYGISEDDLLQQLDDANIIKRNNDFKEGGFEYIKTTYPLAFEGVGSNKVRNANTAKKKITIRTEKYSELKDLWEKLNQKVVLEYKIASEDEFKKHFNGFLSNYATVLQKEGLGNKKVTMRIEDKQAVFEEEVSVSGNDLTKIATMRYADFLKTMATELNINLKTLHACFIESNININDYVNHTTIRTLKQKFNNYLLYNAIDAFGIGYQKVTNALHPTKLTNADGEVLNEINASDVGVLSSNDTVASNYLFNELFFDSDLERQNIKENITEVTVFTKIPKNSIKIPVAGGRTYSPDFAYVLNYKGGNKTLYFIVETKNADKESLRDEEVAKIRQAEQFFGEAVQIKFKSQFKTQKITELIKEVYGA